MTYFVSVTSQGQISIPAPIRKKIGLDKVKKASVRLEGNTILISPLPDIESLMGSLKTKKRFTHEEERAAFEDALARGEA